MKQCRFISGQVVFFPIVINSKRRMQGTQYICKSSLIAKLRTLLPSHLYLNGAYMRFEEGLFTRECSNKTRGMVFS